MMRELRIVLVDNDDRFRAQLRQVIEHGTTYTVVGEGADGQDAIDLTARLEPDAVVLNARLPHVDGVEATKVIKAQHPRLFVIGLVGSELQVPTMRAAGADSCLPKTQSLAMLFDLLASIAQGLPVPQTAAQTEPAEVVATSPKGSPPPLSLEIDAPLSLPQDDALLRLILDGVQDAIAVTEVLSPEAPPRTIFVNRAFSSLLGRGPNALVGRTLDFWDRVFGDPEQRRAITERVLGGETVELELPIGTKGSDPLHLQIRGIDTISGSYIVCTGRAGVQLKETGTS